MSAPLLSVVLTYTCAGNLTAQGSVIPCAIHDSPLVLGLRLTMYYGFLVLPDSKFLLWLSFLVFWLCLFTTDDPLRHVVHSLRYKYCQGSPRALTLDSSTHPWSNMWPENKADCYLCRGLNEWTNGKTVFLGIWSISSSAICYDFGPRTPSHIITPIHWNLGKLWRIQHCFASGIKCKCKPRALAELGSNWSLIVWPWVGV